MKSIIEKQILEFKEELKTHKERLEQAQAVVANEIKFINMLEGGVQAQELLLKKVQEEEEAKDKQEIAK